MLAPVLPLTHRRHVAFFDTHLMHAHMTPLSQLYVSAVQPGALKGLGVCGSYRGAGTWHVGVPLDMLSYQCMN